MHAHPKEYVEQHHVQAKVYGVTACKTGQFTPTGSRTESKVTGGNKITDESQYIACGISKVVSGSQSEQYVIYAIVDAGSHRPNYAEPDELCYPFPVSIYQIPDTLHIDSISLALCNCGRRNGKCAF